MHDLAKVGWTRLSIWLGAGATCAALAACSGESNSEEPGGSAGSGGAASGGTAGTASGGRAGTPSSAGADEGGAPGTGGTGSGDCSERESFTLAVHVVIPVTWPGTLGTQAGSGDFHLWNRMTFAPDGTTLTGRTSPCGSTLPPLELTALVGGGMSLLEISTAIWDSPSFPDFPSSGTLSGWEPGSLLTTNPTTILVGSMLDDPNGAWPDSYTGLTAVDDDEDGNPGITSVPRTGGGYNPPPVSIVGPRASQIYVTSRTATALDGELSSCTELSGTATLELFDNHVVGCETDAGAPCSAGQTDFVDDNRTRYTTMPGTFTGAILDADATCEDVRAALPM